MRRAALTSLVLVALIVDFPARLGITTPAAAADASGVMAGTVRYENGDSASGAAVYASPIGRPMAATSLRPEQTKPDISQSVICSWEGIR